MALVTCIECGNQVSDSAPMCPRCGYQRPVAEGQLIVQRKTQLNSGGLKTEVYVDGVPYGGVRPGGSVTIDLEPGTHELAIRNRFKGLESTGGVIIKPGQATDCLVSFNLMGALKVEVG